MQRRVIQGFSIYETGIYLYFLFQGGSSPNDLRNLGAKEAKDLYIKLGRLPIQVNNSLLCNRFI